jgi:hypothetical protein
MTEGEKVLPDWSTTATLLRYWLEVNTGTGDA